MCPSCLREPSVHSLTSLLVRADSSRLLQTESFCRTRAASRASRAANAERSSARAPTCCTPPPVPRVLESVAWARRRSELALRPSLSTALLLHGSPR